MRKLLISLVILILLVSGIIVVFNSSKNDAKKEYGKISVIATIYPIYDFAREIAGDKLLLTCFFLLVLNFMIMNLLLRIL